MLGLQYILMNLKNTLEGGQNNTALDDFINNMTGEGYTQTIKSFFRGKSSPDNLANEIHANVNTEAVIMILENNSGIIKHITNKFYLSNMQITMREKFQLMETFGAANVSFFGESARIYVFTANTIDAPGQGTGVDQSKYYYQSSILKMYNDVLRGSQLIKEKRIAVMKVHNHLIYGYPLNLQVVYDANNSPITSFVLQFLVAEHSLELPGVLKEETLAHMYSLAAHIDDDRVRGFLQRIDKIIELINTTLNTSVDTNKYNSIGKLEINSGFSMNTSQPVAAQEEFTGKLQNNVSALDAALRQDLNGEISPLVESKVPKDLMDKLKSSIDIMFKSEENYDKTITYLKNLIELRKDLFTFKNYRLKTS